MRETLQISRIGAGVALALTAFTIATMGSQAAPQPIIVSAHSSTAAANCWITGPGRVEDSPIRVCRGKATLVVLVNKADDLRETVSVGRNRDEAAKEPAAQTSFGPFKQALPAIEWRIAGGNPFAIIQRWRMADNGKPAANGSPESKPLLVVSRLPPGAVCPVAYVDAAANPDADELARTAADEFARGFTCGKDQPKIVGAGGRAAELATQR
jgi:hypothetical protein